MLENNLGHNIIKRLPYEESFLFVDEISYVDENKITGHYTFTKDAFFYNAHFKNNPVTPGVILIEMMGQIGSVCHLVYIQKLYLTEVPFYPILSHIAIDFNKQVLVEDKLTVISNKIYYRNKILKSDVELLDSKNNLCASSVVQLQLIIK